MERKKNILILTLFLIAGILVPASGAMEKQEIYRAYVSNRMDLWKKVIDDMEAQKPSGNEKLAELVNYQYGYIGYCIGFKLRDEAKKYLTLAEKNVDILESRNHNKSEVNAYRCAFYGFRIGLNKLSAPVNGLKSIDHAKKAIELGPDNYFAWIQYGNIQFYMPSTFGGSKQEGIGYFLKARGMMEKDRTSLKDNWNYLSLLAIIGQSYTYTGELASARAVYEEILRIEPGFLYVRDELLPELLTKMKN